MRRTFEALSVHNFRLYFAGQLVSVSGTWMQTIALGLLVLSKNVHGNGFDVGMTMALQFVPMLLLGSFGGLVADRVEKRRLLYATQGAAALLALALGLLVAFGKIDLVEIYGFATLLGVVNLFDNPARQTFVAVMVGRDLVPNAVSLNSSVMNSARIIGPAIGAVLIASVGYAVCFEVNAGSYVAVLVALMLMRKSEMHQVETAGRAKGQVREGFRYVWGTPDLRDPLLAMAVVGIFAFNFTTTLPLLAKVTFRGGPGTYSALTVAMASGAVVGGLWVAHRSRPSAELLSAIGLAFGALILLVAGSPNKTLALIALVPMGMASLSFIATANATLQLRSKPELRGRVMALYATAFLGSTPIGAPLIGWISDESSPRVALLVGGLATLGAAAWLGLRLRARHEVGALVPAPSG